MELVALAAAEMNEQRPCADSRRRTRPSTTRGRTSRPRELGRSVITRWPFTHLAARKRRRHGLSSGDAPRYHCSGRRSTSRSSARVVGACRQPDRLAGVRVLDRGNRRFEAQHMPAVGFAPARRRHHGRTGGERDDGEALERPRRRAEEVDRDPVRGLRVLVEREHDRIARASSGRASHRASRASAARRSPRAGSGASPAGRTSPASARGARNETARASAGSCRCRRRSPLPSCRNARSAAARPCLAGRERRSCRDSRCARAPAGVRATASESAGIRRRASTGGHSAPAPVRRCRLRTAVSP